MGNQACTENHSFKNPCCEDSQPLSLIDLTINKNPNEDPFERFPKLSTISDENSSSHVPKYQEIQKTCTQVSVGKRKGHQRAKTNSSQVSIEVLSVRLPERNEQNVKKHEYVEPIKDFNAYQSEGGVSNTVRQHQSHIFPEHNKQTDRKYKRTSLSKSPKRNDAFENENISRQSKEYIRRKENEFDRMEKRRKLLESSDQSDSDFVLTQRFGSQKVTIGTSEALDPIEQFLKRFPNRDCGMDLDKVTYNPNQDYDSAGQIQNSLTPKKNLVYDRIINEEKILMTRGLQPNYLERHVPEQIIRETTNEDYTHSGLHINIKGISSSDSPRARITSENILSEPNINETSQLVLGEKRLWNYDSPEGVNLQSIGKYLSSVTEFENEKLAKQLGADGLRSGDISIISHGTPSKRSSLQETRNSIGLKPNIYIQENMKSLHAREQAQEPENTSRSDHSSASLSVVSINNYIREKSKERSPMISRQHVLQKHLLNASGAPRSLKSTKNVPAQRKERNYSEQLKVQQNGFGRISIVAECLKEAELSFDSLNRTDELSMMSPNNIESNYKVQTPPKKVQKRSLSPSDRNSLRQFVLSKGLKINLRYAQEEEEEEENNVYRVENKSNNQSWLLGVRGKSQDKPDNGHGKIYNRGLGLSDQHYYSIPKSDRKLVIRNRTEEKAKRGSNEKVQNLKEGNHSKQKLKQESNKESLKAKKQGKYEERAENNRKKYTRR